MGSARREKKKKSKAKGSPIWLESARVEACTAQYPAGWGVTLPFERKTNKIGSFLREQASELLLPYSVGTKVLEN